MCAQNNNRGGYNAGERNTDQTPFSGEEEIYYMVREDCFFFFCCCNATVKKFLPGDLLQPLGSGVIGKASTDLRPYHVQM